MFENIVHMKDAVTNSSVGTYYTYCPFDTPLICIFSVYDNVHCGLTVGGTCCTMWSDICKNFKVGWR